MFHGVRLCLAGLLLLVPFSLINGQTAKDPQGSKDPAKDPKSRPTASKDQAIKGAKVAEPDPEAAQRRVVAMGLITSLADESRSFRDQNLRARVQARAADALWTTDVEKARDLFRRAWESAEIADAENARSQAEDARRQREATGVVVRRQQRDLRLEVLRLTAKRDRGLSEEFLKKLEEASEREANDAKNNNAGFPDNMSGSPAASKRLQLARRLLADGEVELAIQFATPVLDQVNRDSIYFLSDLRERNPQAADAAFVSLLARAERDPASDANTVSGLSSYAFTPFLYMTFSGEGQNASRDRPDTPAPDLPANVRAQFFRVAANILLRPLLPPDQDRTSSGRGGKYMVIKRLLPLFEQYVPDTAAALRAQLAALSGDVPADARGDDNGSLSRGLVPGDGRENNPLDRLQDRIDHARTSAERDGIYADVAVALANRGDAKGRELVDKIDNSDLRKQVRAYTDFDYLDVAVRNKDAQEVTRLAKTSELTHAQRVWAYTQAARLLMDSERPRAASLLEDAAAEARRIEAGDPDRARALVGVATLFVQADRVRAWETIGEAVKAGNAAESFTGDGGQISAQLRTPNMVMARSSSAEDFDLLKVFGLLARDDLYRSVELARSFTGEAPRASASLAIARAILEEKAPSPRN